MKTEIYQIYYSSQTRRQLDSGFIALDNRENSRPDWREYWPIRQFALKSGFTPGKRYGFVSPNFFRKTRLHAREVHAFVAGSSADIVSFSSSAMRAAHHWNVAHEAETDNRGFASLVASILPEIGLSQNLLVRPMTFRESVYDNFFAAPAAFWLRWVELANRVHDMAEDPDHPLSGRLNAPTVSGGAALAIKVLIIERLVAFMLANEPQWTVDAYFPYHGGVQEPEFGHGILRLGPCERDEWLMLDGLKQAFRSTGQDAYLIAYKAAKGMIRQRQVHWRIWQEGVNRAGQ
ncbi:MAG: hypothetical protein RJA24_718 [Pseudomonadota bacterium]